MNGDLTKLDESKELYQNKNREMDDDSQSSLDVTLDFGNPISDEYVEHSKRPEYIDPDQSYEWVEDKMCYYH